MTTRFQTPQRQNFRGILVIFLMELAKRLRQNIYAFLPLLSSNIRNNYLHFVIIGIIVLLFLQLLYSYKSYLNFKFHINGNRFFLREGVFKFTDTDVPFDRIQNININQNLIQQVLNVVGLEIETAGQGSAEIKIKALLREDANVLKEILLKNKSEENLIEPALEDDHTKDSKKIKKTLFRIDIGRLLKVGLSANYLKGFGLVFVFFMSLFQYVEDFFKNLYDVDVTDQYLSQLNTTIGVFVSLAVIITIISFLVTVISSVVKYFEFKITQLRTDFEVEYGLFKRINQVIKKSKTQVFELETNPIKDLFKIKSVFVSQASSQELTDKKKIGLVGLTGKEVQVLFESLFELKYNQEFVVSRSSKRLIFRWISIYTLICVALGLSLYFWTQNIFILIIPVLLFSLLLFVAFKKIKKSYVGVNGDLILVHSGSIHTNKKYIATHKIQSLAIKRNLFQQRNQHADLIINTASGSERINYLKLDDALKIMNFLNYKVESSTLSWI